MTNFEAQQNRLEPTPTEEVKVLAFLDDTNGKRYFLKTMNGSFVYLDQALDRSEIVEEDDVASAVMKHGYKVLNSDSYFPFGKRKEILISEK